MLDAVRSNAFLPGEMRSPEKQINDKLRLALGRGLAAAYTEVVQEPIPESLQFWLRQLETRERRGRA